jgi:hypothetical protein
MWRALQSLSAMTGAVVAILGLSTWRAQLHGQVRYRLARRVLTATFAYRDTVRSARFPGSILDVETVDPDGRMPYQERLRHAQQRDYKERWDRISRARSVIEAALIEAEAVWGKSCRAPFEALWGLENKLYGAFLEQIDLSDPNNNETASREEREQIRRTIYRHTKNDPIDPRLDQAINAVEERFAPYLRSHRFNLSAPWTCMRRFFHKELRGPALKSTISGPKEFHGVAPSRR